jgi:hypothetical protein
MLPKAESRFPLLGESSKQEHIAVTKRREGMSFREDDIRVPSTEPTAAAASMATRDRKLMGGFACLRILLSMACCGLFDQSCNRLRPGDVDRMTGA